MPNPTQDRGVERPAADGARQELSSAVQGRAASARRQKRSQPREPTLAELAWTLAERRFTIAAVLAFAVLGGTAFLFLARPVYRASVLVQVEGRARPAAPEDVVQLFDTTPTAESEMRLLRSRALLAEVVEELGLDTEALPRRFPLVGDAIARLRDRGAPASAPAILARFAWGGERVHVSRLEVSDALVDRPLVLVAHEDDAFEVRGEDGTVLAAGMVGTLAKGGSGEAKLSILVTQLVARPETEFTLRKHRTDQLVEGLEKKLEVTEQGRPGGLVEVRLSGEDSALLARFLEALASNYVRESLERTSAEAANTLRVIEARLPDLKTRVDEADAALSRFHQRNPNVNLSLDAQRLIARAGELERAITEAELAQADQARRHTLSYPELELPRDRARFLQEQRSAVDERISALPALELEQARLTRRLDLATERYLRVSNRADDLRTAKQSWIGNARILEHAVAPLRPVSPKAGLVLALASLLGLAGGVAAAFARSAFSDGVQDPAELEARTGLPVFAAIPRSAAQGRLDRRAAGRIVPLCLVEPGDPAVEDLRALRTAVQFSLGAARNNVVAIASPAPAAGKSFVTVNLALLLAAPDRRVLIIDGDLRRGVLHRYFGLPSLPGLSDVLSGDVALSGALHRTEEPNVDLVPAGGRVTHPAELLSGESLRRVIEEVGSRYAVVVIDTPPILSVADSAIVARHAGSTFLLVRSGEQTAREIALALNRLAQNGVTVRGAVLNDVRPTLGRYGKSGRYRRYDTRPA